MLNTIRFGRVAMTHLTENNAQEVQHALQEEKSAQRDERNCTDIYLVTRAPQEDDEYRDLSIGNDSEDERVQTFFVGGDEDISIAKALFHAHKIAKENNVIDDLYAFLIRESGASDMHCIKPSVNIERLGHGSPSPSTAAIKIPRKN